MPGDPKAPKIDLDFWILLLLVRNCFFFLVSDDRHACDSLAGSPYHTHSSIAQTVFKRPLGKPPTKFTRETWTPSLQKTRLSIWNFVPSPRPQVTPEHASTCVDDSACQNGGICLSALGATRWYRNIPDATDATNSLMAV